MTIYDLLKDKGIMYGSRALGVHTEESDYDFAILHTDVLENKELFMDCRFGDPLKYFQTVPETPFAMIYKTKLEVEKEMFRADILVLTDEDDLQVIVDAVSDVCDVPMYMLKDKDLRVRLYQLALENYGWRNASSSSYKEIDGLPSIGHSFQSAEEQTKVSESHWEDAMQVFGGHIPDEMSAEAIVRPISIGDGLQEAQEAAWDLEL